MGGYAVALHGYPRATVDLDFLVDRVDLDKIDDIMHRLGYELRHRSDDVSQFVCGGAVCGQVDYIHAFREASKRMLAEARPMRLFPRSPHPIEIMVLKVEDVIGLKVQAIANNPQRREQHLADIRALVEANRSGLNWRLLADYFELFGLLDVYNDLEKEK